LVLGRLRQFYQRSAGTDRTEKNASGPEGIITLAAAVR